MNKFPKNITLFVNPNGVNESLLDFVKLLSDRSDRSTLKLSILSLNESLPTYANFPNPKRKERLEDILQQAALREAELVFNTAKDSELKADFPVLVEGRFPAALTDWIDSSSTDLVVKQALDCDGEYGFASKGDIKLTRSCTSPVLLLDSPIQTGDSVLVGIAPLPGDSSRDRFCIRLVEAAAQWASLLKGTLYVTHAWDALGEYLIRSRVSESYMQSYVNAQEVGAKKAVKRVLSKCKIEGKFITEMVIGKGAPLRVINASIDLYKPGLVVLGSHANKGLKGALLGNTAENVVRRKTTSVLVIR